MGPVSSSLQEALCCGSLSYHWGKVSEGEWCGRVCHIVMVIFEAIPGLGQLVSLVEWLFLRCCVGRCCIGGDRLLPFDQPVRLSFAEVAALKIYISNSRSALPEYSDSIFEVQPMAEDRSNVVIRKRATVLAPAVTVIPKIQLPSKRELVVKKLDNNSETLGKIGHVARAWQRLAWDKEKLASRNEEVIFKDLGIIAKLIAQCMEHPDETSHIWNSIYVCEDVAQREIQAIALIYVSVAFAEWKIAHLATHPHNVRSSANKDEGTRVEGAGSAIVRHLVKEVSGSKNSLYLESVSSARPFYEGHGFEEMPNEIPEEAGTIPMRLSSEKILKMHQKAG